MLELKNISKVYKQKGVSVTALNNINIKFADTGLVFLLGKSGSGKSSLLNIIGNLDKQTSGEILLDGNNVSKFKGRTLDSYLNSYIGFIFQDYNLIDEYNVYKNIDIALSLQRKKKNKENINKILEIVGLTGLGNRKTNELSGGQKRRAAIAGVLAMKPKVLVLDEPTAAMDTSTRQHFWKIIQNLKEKGVTIFYSSHYIEEVEHTAERILVLHRGKLLRDTTPFAMREAEHEKQLTLSKIFLPIVEKLSDINNIEVKNDTVTFMTKEIDSVWQKLQKQGCQITDIEIQNKSLLNTLFEQTEEMEK